MKLLLPYLLLILPVIVCRAQTEKLEEAALRFELPNAKWALASKQDLSGKTVHTYKREPITDKLGRQVIPNIAFITETLTDSVDVVTYSISKRASLPLEIKEVFTPNSIKSRISHKNAMGYKGIYTDKAGLEHTIYLVYIVTGLKASQAIFDITSELAKDYDKEFLITLKSLQPL